MERAPFNGEAAISPTCNDYLPLRRPQAPTKTNCCDPLRQLDSLGDGTSRCLNGSSVKRRSCPSSNERREARPLGQERKHASSPTTHCSFDCRADDRSRSSAPEFSPRLGSRRLGLGRVRRRLGRRRADRRSARRALLRRLLRLRLSGLCLWRRLSVLWLWLWLQQLWLCPGLLRQLRLRAPGACLLRNALSSLGTYV